MATNNVVPRANLEGSIGTNTKRWNNGYYNTINAYNGNFTRVNASNINGAVGVQGAYQTVANMVADDKLKANCIVSTLGYYSAGDNGSALYNVRAAANGETTSNGKIIVLANGLVAEMIVGDYVIPEQFGAKGDGTTDDYSSIQAAMDSCKNVMLTNGKTYKVNTVLIVNQGQKINLNGATIKRAGGLFVNAKKTDTYTGFNGIGNIEICNGIIEQGEITFIHAKNVYIHDIHFQNSAAEHWIEIAGCKHYVIEKCVFDGTTPSSSARNYVECIQFDLCNANAFPYFDDSTNPTYDNTMAEDIIIDNCSFSGATGTLCTCIGSHAVLTDGSEYKYIKITNCTFNNSGNRSVRLANVNYANIQDNTFYQDSVVNLCLSDSCKNIVVQGNTFYNNSSTNIYHDYDINDGTYHGSNWIIKDNNFNFSSAAFAVSAPYVSGVKIVNNTIPYNIAKNPFAFAGTTNVEVLDNTRADSVYLDEYNGATIKGIDMPVRLLAPANQSITTSGASITTTFAINLFNQLELAFGSQSNGTFATAIIRNYTANNLAVGAKIPFILQTGVTGVATVTDATTLTIVPSATVALRYINGKLI